MVDEVAPTLAGQLFLSNDLDVCRNIANRRAQTWQQSGADHFDGWEFKGFGGVGLCMCVRRTCVRSSKGEAKRADRDVPA